MTKIVWGQGDIRKFESGIDRGVLYPDGGTPTPWLGLVAVVETTIDPGVESFYLDGVKYVNYPKNTDWSAKVEAFTAPEALELSTGLGKVVNGFYLANQRTKRFNFTYRSGINDGEEQKINLVYNAMAVPGARAHGTKTDSPSVDPLDWAITAIPPKVPDTGPYSGWKPTAHFSIDSTVASDTNITNLENILYGTSTTDPRFPTLQELHGFMNLIAP